MATSITVILGKAQPIQRGPTTASTLSGPAGSSSRAADCGPAANAGNRRARPKPPALTTREDCVSGRNFTRKVRTTIPAKPPRR